MKGLKRYVSFINKHKRLTGCLYKEIVVVTVFKIPLNEYLLILVKSPFIITSSLVQSRFLRKTTLCYFDHISNIKYLIFQFKIHYYLIFKRPCES